MKIFTKSDYMTMIDDDAKEYVNSGVLESVIRNRHMNNLGVKSTEEFTKLMSKELFDLLSDAILVDFINYLGYKQGLDYGMYTKDLREARIIT